MPIQLTQILSEKLLIFDGAMGTELYARHVFTNRSYDEICLSIPNLVSAIHNDYVEAGADVLTTNSFGANAITLKQFGLSQKVADINRAAVRLARQAADACTKRKIYVAGSLGPIATLGNTKDQQRDALLEQAKVLIESGVDFLIFETLPSRTAAEIASQVMKELDNDFPFVLSHSMPDDHTAPELVAQRLAPFPDLPQPQAMGLNCGTGPAHMLNALESAVKATTLPIIVQPNAGTPHSMDGRQLYLCSPEYLFTYAMRYANLGARAIGGCCGTTPAHIKELARAIKPLANTSSAIEIKDGPAPSLELLPEKPLAERSKLGRKLAEKQWIRMVEMAPPASWDATKLIEKARLCQQNGIDTLNVPDGPRACPRLSAMVAAMLIQQNAGIETVLHVCARDRNMIGLQADFLGAAACGLRNFLLITGDPPKLGNYSFASGVFDTDSIGLVKLLKHLNQGCDLGRQPVKPATEAVIGVGADPSAIDFDREVRRMREKAAAGANYITTQPVFDPNALFRFMDAIADLNLPVIAGIWPLVSYRNALFMRNEVPGVVVPDSIMERMSKPDTGEKQLEEGLRIARESIEAIRNRVAGVQVSAPLGRIQAALDVLK